MTLGARGTVFVTLAAADQFASFTGLRIEEARRRLTELMIDARLRPDGKWRRRSRADGVDIEALVVDAEPLMIVTHIHIRGIGRDSPGDRQTLRPRRES